MEGKEGNKMENNFFESVVLEDTNAVNANSVLVLQLLVVVTPVVDSNREWCGLNE